MDADGQQHTLVADTPSGSACPVRRRSTSWLEATDLLRGCQDDEDERCLRQLCSQLMAPVKGLVAR